MALRFRYEIYKNQKLMKTLYSYTKAVDYALTLKETEEEVIEIVRSGAGTEPHSFYV